jgi:hypothetical protein
MTILLDPAETQRVAQEVKNVVTTAAIEAAENAQHLNSADEARVNAHLVRTLRIGSRCYCRLLGLRSSQGQEE